MTEGSRKSVSRRVRRWPAAFCCLVTKITKVVKWLHCSFVFDTVNPETFESYTFDPVWKLSVFNSLNLFQIIFKNHLFIFKNSF